MPGMFNFLTLSFTNVLSYIIVILEHMCLCHSLRCSGDFKQRQYGVSSQGKRVPVSMAQGTGWVKVGAWRPFIESGEALDSGKSLSEASFSGTLWQW